MLPALFADRGDAGRQLATKLHTRDAAHVVVLGLTRGGVVVGAEIARALGAHLEAIIVRKIGAPGNPEYAVGALAEDGEPVLNEAEARLLGVRPAYLQQELEAQRRQIAHLQQLYRGGRPLPDLHGKVAVLVDDGIATGYTMRAAVDAARRAGAASVVVAVPVGPQRTLEALRPLVDAVVCVAAPEPFVAVGVFYEWFDQVTDEEVRQCLAGSGGPAPTGSPGDQPPTDGPSE